MSPGLAGWIIKLFYVLSNLGLILIFANPILSNYTDYFWSTYTLYFGLILIGICTILYFYLMRQTCSECKKPIIELTHKGGGFVVPKLHGSCEVE